MEVLHINQTSNRAYYELIMGDSEQSLKHVFHKKWIEFLNSIDLPYVKAIQLRIGSHLRPLLVYWGSAMGAKRIEDFNIEVATEVAICVEIMHKVSVIVDDLIDCDTQRHHKTTFHIQYSPNETIIFAVYMLGNAFEILNSITAGGIALQNERLDLYAKTLNKMATGCLHELKLNQKTRFDIRKIADIISMETSTLIKNSVLLGFLTNDSLAPEIRNLGEEIGDQVGYIFQVMNDLEPFSSPKNIEFHKGELNADFNRSRKNIVMAYLYGACNIKEKDKLLQIEGNSESIGYIFELCDKYKVFDLVTADLYALEIKTECLLDKLALYDINRICLENFYIFFQEIMSLGKARLKTQIQIPID